MSNVGCLLPFLAGPKCHRFSPVGLALLLLMSVFATFSTTAQAQPVEIGTGTLDVAKVLGPKWVRVDFDPLVSGDHDIRVTWDSSAAIRFSVFQLVDAPNPNNKVRIATSSNSASLAEWSGALDTTEDYYLGIWSTSGSGNFIITIEALAALEIVAQPIDQTVTESDDASFSVAATGSGTLTYQWFANDVAIAGATTDTYSVVGTTTADDGNIYRVDITDDNGTLSSDNATLTVDAAVALEIVAQPTDQTVTEGDDASFSVAATGSGTLTYQWFANDQAITGATTDTYSVVGTTTADDGSIYRVDITDDNGTLSSDNATLTVDSTVVLEIVSQATDQTVTEGDDASFSIVAMGDGILTYQWFANDVAIAGATTDSYSVVGTTAADDGNIYRVDITDDNGTLSSDNATLTVDSTVVLEIVSQPTDQTVTEGDDAIFSVVATGNGTLTYQWFANDLAIAGATTDAYSVVGTTAADDGNIYRVNITDDNGTLSSDNAILTVDSTVLLEIVSQPTDQTVTEDDDATFSVVATGDGTLTYQWFANDVAIAGATTDTYSVVSTTSADDGNIYRVDIADDNGTVASDNATLTVDAAVVLEIVAQPTDQTVTEGDDATFSVSATGNGTLTYQWFVNDQVITGAIADTYTLVGTSLSDDGNIYRVDIADDQGTISSDDATLTVDELIALEIVAQPTDETVTEGEDATFSISATGSGTLTYQWFVNDQAVAGATTDTFSAIATTLAEDGSLYRVDVTDDNGTLSSDSAQLEVLEFVVPVTVVSMGQGILDSTKVTGPRWVRVDFDALADATHTIRVSWDSSANVKFKVFEDDGTLISSTVQGNNPGVWSGVLTANAQYYIGLWSANGIANYDATVEATVPVTIERQPLDRIVSENDDVTFYVEAAGSGTLSYQWFADNSPIPGETGTSLTIFAAMLADDGTTYHAEVTNGSETAVSDVATLTVNEPLVLGLFSQVADLSTWMLDGPAPTLDFDAGANTDAWGKTLLRVGDVLLVGGDFEGIKPTRFATPTIRPFLAALDAVSGQPVSTFQVPVEVDDVVRTLALSPDGEQVYVGGDFGLVALDATTGALDYSVSVTRSNGDGRVFDIAVGVQELYIGGDFTNVDNTYRANLARLALDGQLDTQWNPKATHGYTNGRAAPVQSLAISPSGDTVYVGGNFQFIDGTPVERTAQNGRVSLLSVSALDGSVLPERFTADVGNNAKGLTAHDIAVTDFYVIIAWGGPNYVSFHSMDGTRLRQYRAKGDVQALQVVGDHVFVGHHGEFFGTLVQPNPPGAVVSINPEIVLPFKIHSFRIDDPDFLPEQAWQITGAFGVWGIAAAEDSIWVAGQISLAGSNDRAVDGLVRFPAL